MRFRPAHAFEPRIGGVLVLICSAVIGAISYWYPWYLCTYHAAPDDRYPVIIGVPFWFLASGLACWGLFELLRGVMRGPQRVGNAVFVVCGVLLALGGISPIVMFLKSLLTEGL